MEESKLGPEKRKTKDVEWSKRWYINEEIQGSPPMGSKNGPKGNHKNTGYGMKSRWSLHRDRDRHRVGRDSEGKVGILVERVDDRGWDSNDGGKPTGVTSPMSACDPEREGIGQEDGMAWLLGKWRIILVLDFVGKLVWCDIATTQLGIWVGSFIMFV